MGHWLPLCSKTWSGKLCLHQKRQQLTDWMYLLVIIMCLYWYPCDWNFFKLLWSHSNMHIYIYDEQYLCNALNCYNLWKNDKASISVSTIFVFHSEVIHYYPHPIWHSDPSVILHTIIITQFNFFALLIFEMIMRKYLILHERF